MMSMVFSYYGFVQNVVLGADNLITILRWGMIAFVTGMAAIGINSLFFGSPRTKQDIPQKDHSADADRFRAAEFEELVEEDIGSSSDVTPIRSNVRVKGQYTPSERGESETKLEKQARKSDQALKRSKAAYLARHMQHEKVLRSLNFDSPSLSRSTSNSNEKSKKMRDRRFSPGHRELTVSEKVAKEKLNSTLALKKLRTITLILELQNKNIDRWDNPSVQHEILKGVHKILRKQLVEVLNTVQEE